MKLTRKNDVFELKIENKVENYSIKELPKDFVEWAINSRISVYKKILEGKHIFEFGSHLPVLISKNVKGAFPANSTNKGVGFLPKDEYLEFYIKKFRETLEKTKYMSKEASRRMRVEAALDFHKNIDKLDFTRLGGLEIFGGKTMKNIEVDPRVSLHFLGMAPEQAPRRYISFQINCIAQMAKPGDRIYEFEVLIRDLFMKETFHLPLLRPYPCAYTLWVCEAYNKSPHL